MRKSFLLAAANIRKNKGQSVVMAIVLLFATVFMLTGLILIFDFQKNYDRRAEITNSEDVVFSYQTRDANLIAKWRQIILSDSRTAELLEQESLCHAISYQYGGGEINTHTVMLPENTTRSMGKFNFIEKSDNPPSNAIYLSYLMKVGGGYEIGDEFKFTIQSVEIEANTLYPLLRRLEGQELLNSTWDTSQSRPRKYYCLSQKGQSVFNELCNEWAKMNRSIEQIIQGESK